LIGKSGVGKTSLLNALMPGLDYKVSNVNKVTEKGIHTTSSMRLLPIEEDSILIDSPGTREFGLWDVDPDDLDWYFKEMRTLLMELRPDAIVEANPRELLKHLMDAYTGRTGISIDYPEKTPVHSLSGEHKLVNYRVAQEALNNIANHATPSEARILFQVKPSHVDLMLGQWGGFDPNEIQPDHFGVGFMQEPAEGIGANIKIINQPGKGTLVQLTLR
jgi:signal transduction histidine kinase